MAVVKKKFSLKFLSNISKAILKNASVNAVLVVVLIVFAFFLGLLTNKVIYLEQQVKNGGANLAAANQPAAPTLPPVVENLGLGKLPILGNKDAKVTIVEFSDFQCPFCKAYFEDSSQKVYDDYIKTGKVKFVYRHFPLTSIHPNAQKAAEASECANDQGKFWEYHDILFKNQDTWAVKPAVDAAADFVTYAGQLGLDTNQFQSCVSSDQNKSKVDADTNDGTSIAQVDGTPAFFINGTRVTGAVPYDQLKQVIEDQLKK